MVSVFVAAVLLLLFVPLQLPISYPSSGTAPLNEMLSLAWYYPAAQPVELIGEAVGFVPFPV